MHITLNNKIFKHNTLIIFILSLLVRLLYIVLFYYPGISDSFQDDWAYMNLTKNIIEQGFWLRDLNLLGSYSGAVGPGIGWILYPTVKFFGENWLVVFIYVAIGSAFIPVLIYKLAILLYNNRIALFAAFWSIIYIPFIKNTLSTGKDIWMTLLFLLFIYITLQQKNQNRKLIFTITGLSFIYTFLFHLDERFLVFSPFIFLFFLLEKKINIKMRLSKAFLFSVLVIIFSLPWLIRNYQVYNRVIIVSIRTAPYTEKFLGYEHVQYIPPHEGRRYISDEKIDSIRRDLIPDPEKLAKITTPQQIDALKKNIIPHHFSYFETVFANFVNFWEPIDLIYGYHHTGYWFDGKWSFKHNLSIGFSYGIMLLFSLFGFYYLFKKNKEYSILFLSVILIYMLLHILLIPYTNSRYRLPLEPIIIIYGSYGLIKIFSTYNKRIKHFFFNKEIELNNKI